MGFSNLSEVRRDMIDYLWRLRVSNETIFLLVNMLRTDEEAKELICFLTEIPWDVYFKDKQKYEEILQLKAFHIVSKAAYLKMKE